VGTFSDSVHTCSFIRHQTHGGNSIKYMAITSTIFIFILHALNHKMIFEVVDM